MTSSTAVLSWRVHGVKVEHSVQLRNGELLLSEYYLQSLLPPSVLFQGLQAVVDIEDPLSNVNVLPRWDHEDHKHYLLDNTLSAFYHILHSDDCVYVSDSSETKEDSIYNDPVCCQVDTNEEECSTQPRKIHSQKTPTSIQETQRMGEQITHQSSKNTSISTWIVDRARTGRLFKILALCGPPQRTEYLPIEYNGNVCFELPPSPEEKRMLGMEQKYDGHVWSRPSTTNMAIECTVRLSYCIGSLQCCRVTCPYYISEKRFNDAFFHGHLDRQVCMGYPASDDKSKITCHYCEKIVTCSYICSCKIYYVMPKDVTMTRLAIHLGEHTHNVQPGIRRAALEKVRNLVSTVLKIEKGGPRKIQMLVARQMLFKSLTKEDELEASDLELNHFLEEMMPLVQNRGFKGIIANEKTKQDKIVGDGYDNILMLQKRCVFPFFHGSRFPGQGGPKDKCYLFKMSTKGPASGVELVNRMRQGGTGDLRSAWVHFDHTHRIEGWATMSCSVYDPGMRSLQVIAICESKEEDEESQILFWRQLNSVMERCGHEPPDFAGFMSDEAGANWLAIRTVYNGGRHNVMEGRERSCLFHWEQSLQKHTKKHVIAERQMHHIEICEAWRLARTTEETFAQASAIRSWWVQNVAKDDIKDLEQWFSWWEKRIAHWGSAAPMADKRPWDKAQIPSINLSESIHASWLAGEGGRRKISLYDACVSDVLNAYIQCAKRLGYSTGRFIGTGPSIEAMMANVKQKESPNPTCIANTLKGLVAGSPLYEERVMEGDKETVLRKKKRSATGTSSHKPGYVMEARQRKTKGRQRSIRFDEKDNEEIYILDDDEEETTPKTPAAAVGFIQEVEVAREEWAFRRMPTNCVRKCFGKEGKKNCSNKLQSRQVGLVAPCFWSDRVFKDKTIAQWIWFCNHDVKHTQGVQRQVKFSPVVPTLWPVDIGTNLSKEERDSLMKSGFQLANLATPVRNNDHMCATSSKRGSSSRRCKWRHGISKEAQKRLESAACMDATFMEEIVISEGHLVFRVLTETCYDVHIKEEPYCTCPDFQKRESMHKAFLACKHMYYVYVNILGLQPKEHMVIHQPTLTTMDLAFVLGQTRKLNPIL